MNKATITIVKSIDVDNKLSINSSKGYFNEAQLINTKMCASF